MVGDKVKEGQVEKELEKKQVGRREVVNMKRFGTELNPSGFPMESLIWIKEQSNDCPNFYSVKTLLNPNLCSITRGALQDDRNK